MKKNTSKGFMIVLVVLLSISMCAAYVVYHRVVGSTEKMNLDTYYALDKYNENAIPLVVDTQLLENKAYSINDKIYIDQNVASTMIDSKIYWDKMNTSVIIATPNEIITIPANKNEYYVDGVSKAVDEPLLQEVAEGEYAILLEFIQKYVNVEYELYESPKRVVMRCGWGNNFVKVKVNETDMVRYKADKDSEILTKVKKDDILYVLTEDVQSYMRYVMVMTKDGIIGYVRNKKIDKPYEEVMSNDYKGLDYTPMHMDKKVCLGWLQVSNMSANNNLKNLVNRAKGVNVVSPTWFSLADSNGGIKSLASKNFVTYAHSKGIKVWALVDDFSKEVRLMDIISNTESRTTFIDNLVYNTKDCGADGINIDFEHITVESSVHYIQFLRELRIKCHKNNLVLSVDSYVPLSYNAHYNIDEQNEFVDYVVIMAYDEYHSKSTTSGPVASITYTDTAVKKALEKVNKDKLIVAVPFYTRIWGEVNDEVVFTAALGMNEAYNRIIKEGGIFGWDEETKQYYAEFVHGDGIRKVWLENKKSINEKVALIMKSDVAGIGAWRLGYETTDVWSVINAHLK